MDSQNNNQTNNQNNQQTSTSVSVQNDSNAARLFGNNPQKPPVITPSSYDDVPDYADLKQQRNNWKTREYLQHLQQPTDTRKFADKISSAELQQLKDDEQREFGDVLKQIEQNAQNTPTKYLPNRDTDRENWVNEEIKSQQSKRKINNDKMGVLLIGLPGSGKSNISEPLANSLGAYIIDDDLMKEHIPEFVSDPTNATRVHSESAKLSAMMRSNLLNQGSNVIINKVGADYGQLMKYAKQLKDNGYNIKFILNDLPYDKAHSRSRDRYRSGGVRRLTPLWKTLDTEPRIFESFDSMLGDQTGMFSGGAIYSNDVPKGTKPKMILKSGDINGIKI